MKTEREIQIDTYIEKCPEAKQVNNEPVFIHGQIRKLDVFRLPIKLLAFNIANGRFAAELIAAENRLNRKLDTTKEEDVKVIQKLLLEQDKNETETLKADLKKMARFIPASLLSMERSSMRIGAWQFFKFFSLKPATRNSSISMLPDCQKAWMQKTFGESKPICNSVAIFD